MRLLLTLMMVGLIALCMYGMWRGWRNRARRQSEVIAEFPTPPAQLSQEDQELPVLSGIYVGTTKAGQWVERIVISDIGYRSPATVTAYLTGILIDRADSSPLWIDKTAIQGVAVSRGLVGKIASKNGVLIFRWQHGESVFDTGIRATNKSDYSEWTAAFPALLSSTQNVEVAP